MLSGKVLSAVRLACILDHRKTVAFGEFNNWIHVGTLSIQVHRYNSSYGSTTSKAGEMPRSICGAVAFQILPQLSRIHIVSMLLNIHELGQSPCLRNRFGSSNKGMRYGDDHVTWAHTGSDESKSQCISPTADCDSIFGVAEGRECTLKAFHHRPANEPGGS